MADKDKPVRFVRIERPDGGAVWHGELTIEVTVDEQDLADMQENYPSWEATVGDLLAEAGEEIMSALEEAGSKASPMSVPSNYKELN